MVKLIFDFEIVDAQDGPEVRGERMWAMVSEEIEGRYLGLLVDEPQASRPVRTSTCAPPPRSRSMPSTSSTSTTPPRTSST